jgi:predicted metal-dependent phosphoesterase TrpH
VRLDLHVHTSYSGDSSLSIKQLFKWISVQRHLNGIAITDHDTLRGYNQLTKQKPVQMEFLIIPGIEITLKEGHMVVLGVSEEPKKAITTVYDVADYAREHEGIVVIPHPYRSGGIGALAETSPADAVETINLHAKKHENKMARLLAKARGLPQIAGSDAHEVKSLGMAYTDVEAEGTIEDALKGVKNGKAAVYKLPHQSASYLF